MSSSVNIKNKRARFEFELIEDFTAGIQLTGTEIKSIREGKASIVEAFGVVVDGEVFIRNMTIQPYANGTHYNHSPKRDRKLLLNRVEIKKIHKKLKTTGITLVPVRLFINEKGLAKLHISVGRGKKLHDKREDLKSKDAKREMDRRMKY